MRGLLFVLALFMPTLASACEITAKSGAPIGFAPGKSICRSGYELLYRPEYKTPYWVAEHVTAKAVQGPFDRDDDFQPDPMIPDHLEAQLSDYYKSGYARGHMAPVGNFRDDPKEAQESFYLSNMVPQVQKCNNAGVWAQIERVVRDWAVHYEELYVVTGPVYQGFKELYGIEIGSGTWIGNGVRVPDALFKVVWNPRLNQTIAFVVPNQQLCKTKPKQFVTTIDHVTALTGIRFFPNVRAEPARGLWQ